MAYAKGGRRVCRFREQKRLNRLTLIQMYDGNVNSRLKACYCGIYSELVADLYISMRQWLQEDFWKYDLDTSTKV